MLSDQGYKGTAAVVLFCVSLFRFANANQALSIPRVTHRNYQPATNLELRDQRLRDVRPTSSNEDCVIRRMGGPTQCPIKTFDRCIVNFQLPNPCLGSASK